MGFVKSKWIYMTCVQYECDFLSYLLISLPTESALRDFMLHRVTRQQASDLIAVSYNLNLCL